MVIESLKIKNKSYYFWDDIIHVEDFDPKLLKINRRESRVGVDIYYIGYITIKPEYDINSVNPLYLVIRYLIGHLDKIDGSDDRYLVIDNVDSNKKVLDVFDKLWKEIKDEINDLVKDYDKIRFGSDTTSLIGVINKIRFSSDIDLPLNTSIKFHALTVVINCVIEKNVNIIRKYI